MKLWVGEYVRTYRLDMKVPQETLAAVAGISQGQLSRIENCEVDPGFHELLMMLQFLHRTMNDILRGYQPAPITLAPKGRD